ncbi:MAG: hypothetical protein ACOCRK_07325 [bacterium]
MDKALEELKKSMGIVKNLDYTTSHINGIAECMCRMLDNKLNKKECLDILRKTEIFKKIIKKDTIEHLSSPAYCAEQALKEVGKM